MFKLCTLTTHLSWLGPSRTWDTDIRPHLNMLIPQSHLQSAKFARCWKVPEAICSNQVFRWKMWPLAMQHHATAINASPQLDGSESPWQLRFGEGFPAMHIPFGAKVLFWNSPKRVDNSAGKLSPTSNEGIFLGYYIQPVHDWKGEYLVAKLEAADYHVSWGALTIQRTKKLELPWRRSILFRCL